MLVVSFNASVGLVQLENNKYSPNTSIEFSEHLKSSKYLRTCNLRRSYIMILKRVQYSILWVTKMVLIGVLNMLNMSPIVSKI